MISLKATAVKVLKSYCIAPILYVALTSETMAAWRPFGSSNTDLIHNLNLSGIVKSADVSKAMSTVDRANYAPYEPYYDSPQPIGFGQTISAPHMHAYALEHLLPNLKKPGAHILDVGCGSGYLAAVFARLNEGAKVYGIDNISGLVDLSTHNTRKADGDLLDSGRLIYSVGDGWKGLSEGAPYDAIHVGAAASSVPKDLVTQLKVGGTIFIPVGGSFVQNIMLVTRTKEGAPLEESFDAQELMPVRYVPLVKSAPHSPMNSEHKHGERHQNL